MFEEEEVKGWSDRKSLGTTDLHPTRWVGFVTEESATDSRKFRQSQSCFSVLLLRSFLLAAPTKSTLFVNFVWLRPDEHLLNTAKLCKSLSTWRKCIMLVKSRNSAHCWTAEERFTARGKVMCHHDAAPDWSQGFLLDLRETKLQLWKVILHFFPSLSNLNKVTISQVSEWDSNQAARICTSLKQLLLRSRSRCTLPSFHGHSTIR